MIEFSSEALSASTPNAQPLYEQMLERFDVLAPYGILDSELRTAHFMAQCLHETGGLRILVENLNYTTPERLVKVWPKRFTLASARHYVGNPRRLANFVYGGRLGNVEPDDGWRFIGRGLLQLTGRSSYARIGDAVGLPLVSTPAMVLYPEHGLRIAGEIWHQARCNIFADADDVMNVTRRINGGLVGLEDRKAWLVKTRRMVKNVIP